MSKPLYVVVDQEQAYALRILIRQHRIRHITDLVVDAAVHPENSVLDALKIIDIEDHLMALDHMVIMGQAADDSEWLFRTLFDGKSVPPREENVELFMTETGRDSLILMLNDLPVPKETDSDIRKQAYQFVADEAEGLLEALHDAAPVHEEIKDDTEEIWPDATQRKPNYKN